MSNVIARYLIETAFDPQTAAAIMAGEQSTGTFVTLPGETEELHANHAAKVRSVEIMGETNQPSLPYAITPDKQSIFKQALVEIEYPIVNFGISLPNLLTTLAGNLYELREFSGLRLLDFTVPQEYQKRYPGGRFGIKGTRRLMNVHDRPLIGTIIKPSVGMPMDQFRALVRELAEAGLDFIKDDELIANPLYASFEERVKVAMEEINRVADRTGKKTMYAFNITGEIDEMKRNHDIVAKHGGNCIMISINSVGYVGVHNIAEYSDFPIHGHRNQWGAMTRHPLLGMSFTAYQKLCRMAGVDHLHTNGLNSKFAESNDSVVTSIKDCLTPLYSNDQVLPVLSSAQWAGSAHPTYEAIKSTDVLHLAGGGILAHPGGTRAGVESIQMAWTAAVNEIPFNELAKLNKPIQVAIEKFGK